MLTIEKVIQSQREWLLQPGLVVTFVHAPLPAGSRGVGLTTCSVKLMEFLKKKKSVIVVPPDPLGICFARALAIAVARVDKHPSAGKLRVDGKEYMKAGTALMDKARLIIGTPVDASHWPLFQTVLGDRYNLIIVSRDHFNKVVYTGKLGALKQVVLYHAESHYHVITKLPGFMGVDYICPSCLKSSHSAAAHVCALTCRYCHRAVMCSYNEWRDVHFCDACATSFPTLDCFEAHKTASLCSQRPTCKTCGKMYLRSKGHKCGSTLCTVCFEYFPKTEPHRCYVNPLKLEEKKQKKPTEYIFYDFESQSSEEDGLHTPNLCVLHKVCSVCMALPMETPDCCECGRERRIFSGAETLDGFMTYLFDGTHSKAIALAHYASGYDSHLLIQGAFARGILPRVVAAGLKYLQVEIQSIRFIDSFRFFSLPLAKLPVTFSFPQACKGHFPHTWNTPEHVGYVGAYPPASAYSPGQMKPRQQKEFYLWYESVVDTVFDFDAELLRYCKMDVEILQLAAAKFRQLVLELTGIEPYEKACTLAALCSRVYRTHHMPPHSLARIPDRGYYRGLQSRVGLVWLSLKAVETGRFIEHAGNTGERLVAGYRVDGYAEPAMVYEFYGCLYHGCVKCYLRRACKSPVSDMTYDELYVRTMRREAVLTSAGYTVESIWECEFDAAMKLRNDYPVLREEVLRSAPIAPRDCLFGGRVSPYKMYHKVDGTGETIEYVDFCSLYPAVMKQSRFPRGSPQVSRGADIPAEVYGFLKCCVLPPRDLYFGVLPARYHGKLLFPLCAKCASAKQQTRCLHAEEDRLLYGTWCTPELDLAVSKGYVIKIRYEAWHFHDTAQYSRARGESGLFNKYVDTFLKVKQQAAGWPAGVDSESARDAYIKEYEQVEGIALEPELVCANPALYFVAKCALNNMWGKMCERSRRTQVSFIQDVEEYISTMTDPSKSVQDIQYVSTEYVSLKWTPTAESVRTLPHSSIVTACFVTCMGRIRLYNLMDGLGKRCIYTDTDSAVYCSRPGEPTPPLGRFLGDLTRETQEGDHIVEFASAGPKSYAFRTLKGEKTVKVRGFTLDANNSEVLNFETMKRLVTTNPDEQTPTYRDCITRDSHSKLRSERQQKVFRGCFDKRIKSTTHYTYPYGYAGEELPLK